MEKELSYARFIVIGLGGGWRTPRDLAFFLSYFMPSSSLCLVDGGSYKLEGRDHENFGGIGNKARVSADFIKTEFPKLDVRVFPYYVGTEQSSRSIAIYELIRSGDIVFLQVDNSKTKKIVDCYAQSLCNITIISGGTNEDQLMVQAYLKRDYKDLTPPFSSYCEDIENPQDESPLDQLDRPEDCQDGIVKQRFHPFTMMCTSTFMMNTFYAIWKLERLGKLPEFPWSELWHDIVTGRSRAEKHPAL